jgi:hypothetical protein
VPLARDLHPEFGYIGNAPAVLRKLGLAIAFVAVGLIAAMSNLSVFVSEPDDPMKAMALAPEQALNNVAPVAPIQLESLTGNAATPARSCGGAITADCAPARMHRSHPIQAANERPAIAAVAIGRREQPAVLPAEPAATVPVAVNNADVPATPPEPAAEAAPIQTPPVEAVTPAAPVQKPRPRTNRPRERNEYARSYGGHSPAYSYHSMQSGYARVW